MRSDAGKGFPGEGKKTDINTSSQSDAKNFKLLLCISECHISSHIDAHELILGGRT